MTKELCYFPGATNPSVIVPGAAKVENILVSRTVGDLFSKEISLLIAKH